MKEKAPRLFYKEQPVKEKVVVLRVLYHAVALMDTFSFQHEVRWEWRQQVYQKRWCFSVKLHDVTNRCLFWKPCRVYEYSLWAKCSSLSVQHVVYIFANVLQKCELTYDGECIQYSVRQ